MERLMIEEIMALLDKVEIESSINIKKNNKTVKIIDQRIICDKETSKTYLVFKAQDENKYTKINLNNILEFISDGFLSALPGDDVDKIHFITSYLNAIPKLDNKKKQEVASPVQKVEKKPKKVMKPDLSDEVKAIILSKEDIIDKIRKLINIKDGKEFIKKMAGANTSDDKIIGSLERLLNTSLGQKCIRKMASKYMSEFEEQIKSWSQ